MYKALYYRASSYGRLIIQFRKKNHFLLTVGMRPRDVIQLAMVLTMFILLVYIAVNPPHFWKRARKIREILGLPKSGVVVSVWAPRECPVDHFAFHIKSGAANVVGPKICFEDHVIMSSVLNNIGPGLNIALINGVTGKTEKNSHFNMYSGKVEDLLQFLKDIKPGTIVLVASYDDPATKLTDEARNVFTNLGSTMIMSLKFRDAWVFAGASGISEKSPFERHMKNEREKNIYDGWPEMLELGGCFPKKL